MKKYLRLSLIILLMACMLVTSSCVKPLPPPQDPCQEGHLYVDGVCTRCGATEPQPIEQEDTSKYTYKSMSTTAYFSTTCTLALFDDFNDVIKVAKKEQTWDAVKVLLGDIEAAISVSIPDSDVARFNAADSGATISISEHTANILLIAKSVYNQTEGFYDPTVYNLVDLWGLTPRFNESYYAPLEKYDRPQNYGLFTSLPEQKYIDAFVRLTDFSKVVIEGDATVGYTVKKMAPSVTVDGVTYQQKLDLGGIGKGYAVEKVCELLSQNGYNYGYFSCGGSSMKTLKKVKASAGAPEEEMWAVGVRKARFENENTGYISVFSKNEALSTSGDYEHKTIIDDVIYCHIINPKTGNPINTPVEGVQRGIATISIFGGNAAIDDALTTALCVQGLDKAMEFMNTSAKAQGLKMVIVLYKQDEEFCEYITNMSAEQFTESDPATHHVASEIDSYGNVIYTGSFLK